MPTAYVLINCDLGSEEEIIREIKKIPETVEVSGVYGVYDIIARISSDSMDKLRETITWHVRRIDKVRSTLTMMAKANRWREEITRITRTEENRGPFKLLKTI
jgi:DNA-binding Lrp family transcriptional regulator